MRALPAALLAAAALAAGAPARAQKPAEPEGADYLPAVRQELARLDLHAVCDDATRTCTFRREVEDGPGFDFVVRLSPATRTVYIYIERYLDLPDPSEIGRAHV